MKTLLPVLGLIGGLFSFSSGTAVAQQAGTSGQMTAGDPTIEQQTPPSTTAFVRPPAHTGPWTLYFSRHYEGSLGSDTNLFVHENGRVYEATGKYVGHLTDDTGNTFRRVPEHRDFQLRTQDGNVIAATRAGSGFDAHRTVQLLWPQD